MDQKHDSGKTGGVFVFYNKTTVTVSNVEVNTDIEQIYFDVESNKKTQYKFELCAFYIRNFSSNRVRLHSIKWKNLLEFGEKNFLTVNYLFFALGDSNCNFENDERFPFPRVILRVVFTQWYLQTNCISIIRFQMD